VQPLSIPWRRLRCWRIPRRSLFANAFVALALVERASLCVAPVIAANAIAAPLVVRKRARSNDAPPGNAISTALRGGLIIGIGNALIAVVSRSGDTPPRQPQPP
jgi:hypothetical protein